MEDGRTITAYIQLWGEVYCITTFVYNDRHFGRRVCLTITHPVGYEKLRQLKMHILYIDF